MDQFGQTLASVVLGDADVTVQFKDTPIPNAVVNAARSLSTGQSRCVDAEGKDSYPGKVFPVQQVPNLNRTKNRYFVLHLADEWPEKAGGAKYQIQILNESGQAISWGYVGDYETEIVVANHTVPTAVVEAARRQPVGKGDFVDCQGQSIAPAAGGGV